MEPSEGHVPVLLAAVLDGLQVVAGGRYVDCTVDGAGHATAILERSAPDGQLLGLDADGELLARARQRLAPFGARVTLRQANFAELADVAAESGWTSADGVLFDLGFSSWQMTDPARGFSFQDDGPLDMRLDQRQETTAARLVNELPERELADLIYQYGEETRSRRIARAIVQARPLTTTRQLAEVVARALGGRRGRLHPATRTFQALRVAVNQELERLSAALPQAAALLRPGGRLAVISFHSLEDRIVKQTIRGAETLRAVNAKPIVAGPAERAANPRSRSARLRIAERAA